MEQQQGGSLDLHEEGEISVSLLLLLLLLQLCIENCRWCFLVFFGYFVSRRSDLN